MYTPVLIANNFPFPVLVNVFVILIVYDYGDKFF